jgi:hypothetical protein
MFQTTVVEKLKTHISCSATLFLIVRLRDKVEKYSKAGQATEDNMAYPHCMLDT